MFRDQMINFLEAAVVFLLLVNATSIVVAMYAIRLAAGSTKGQPSNAVIRRLDAMRRRAA